MCTKVELHVRHFHTIVFGKSIDIVVAVTVDDRSVVVAPQICCARSDGEALEQFPAHTQVELPESTRTFECIGIRSGVGVAHFVGAGIRITHV